MFRLDYLSCFLTILATVLVGRKSWAGLLISIVNSLIVCLIGFRTSQFGFIPANLVCICVYAFSIRSWLKKTHTHRIAEPVSRIKGNTEATEGGAARHASNQPSSPPPTMATLCFTPDAARLARSFTFGKAILLCEAFAKMAASARRTSLDRRSAHVQSHCRLFVRKLPDITHFKCRLEARGQNANHLLNRD
jgi:hypothetical protein